MVAVQASAALDMTSFNFSNLLSGFQYFGTTTTFEVDYADGFADLFYGLGFTYIGSEPVSGLVTAYQWATWAPTVSVLATITGLSVQMTDLVAAANSPTPADDALIFLDEFDGRDNLQGSPFDDVLYGLGDNDKLNGNGGADTFVYFGSDGKDKINGFSSKQNDIIDLSAVDANTGKGRNQKFKYVGDDKPKKAGQLAYDGKKVLGNTDSDKKAELVIKVPGGDLDKGDFIL